MKTLSIRNALKKARVRLALYFGAIVLSFALSGLLYTLGVPEAAWTCLSGPSTGLLLGVTLPPKVDSAVTAKI
jgi:hypothetical protein